MKIKIKITVSKEKKKSKEPTIFGKALLDKVKKFVIEKEEIVSK